MALIRIQLDLGIPENAWDAIPLVKKQAAIQVIRDLKALAVKINGGLPNEEMTVIARWHICHHDEIPGEPCVGQEI